jgi:hypothetical protein
MFEPDFKNILFTFFENQSHFSETYRKKIDYRREFFSHCIGLIPISANQSLKINFLVLVIAVF